MAEWVRETRNQGVTGDRQLISNRLVKNTSTHTLHKNSLFSMVSTDSRVAILNSLTDGSEKQILPSHNRVKAGRDPVKVRSSWAVKQVSEHSVGQSAALRQGSCSLVEQAFRVSSASRKAPGSGPSPDRRATSGIALHLPGAERLAGYR